MYYYPTLQQLKEMPDLNRYGVVPVCCELYADRKTPIEVLRILKHVSSHCYMLDMSRHWRLPVMIINSASAPV